jgi:hypothetical protein
VAPLGLVEPLAVASLAVAQSTVVLPGDRSAVAPILQPALLQLAVEQLTEVQFVVRLVILVHAVA